MDNKSEILCGINNIIEETTTYDFPFLASEKRKREIIEELKKHIEEQLEQLAPERWLPDTMLCQAWNDSMEHANQSFESLPSKVKINGFYLQELMHFYSESLGKIILSRTEEEYTWESFMIKKLA